jgi:uncharacterized protein YjbI with pentapeptide repeats
MVLAHHLRRLVVTAERSARLRPPDDDLLRRLQLHHRWSQFSRDGVRLEDAGLDLSDLDLAGVDLSGAVLLGARFDRSNLRGANLSRADIARSSAEGTELSEAVLYKAEVHRTSFIHVRLRHAILDGMEASHVDLRGADLTGSSAHGFSCWQSDVRGACLRELRLRCTWFDDCLMAEVDLVGSSGTIHRHSRLDLGDPERQEVLEGEALLAWLRRAGADVTWCDE